MSVRRTLTALLGAALLLAGCSDDPEPRVTPTASPSPSESETSAEPTPQSPEEFIREWFELDTEMQNTGRDETFPWRCPDCEPCDELADQSGALLRAAGGYITDR